MRCRRGESGLPADPFCRSRSSTPATFTPGQSEINSSERIGGTTATPSFPRGALLLIDEMIAAVLLPVSLIALAAERFFLAAADRLDAAGDDRCRRQRILYSGGSLVAQRQVIVDGSPLVAVPLARKVNVGCWLRKSISASSVAFRSARNVRPCRSRSKCPSPFARTVLHPWAQPVVAAAE